VGLEQLAISYHSRPISAFVMQAPFMNNLTNFCKHLIPDTCWSMLHTCFVLFMLLYAYSSTSKSTVGLFMKPGRSYHVTTGHQFYTY